MIDMKLGNFLGAVLKEVTLARVLGDFEAARVADLYKNHQLLEGAPIPRFRLPEIVVDIPVAIVQTKNNKEDPLDAVHPAPKKVIISEGIHHAAELNDIKLSAKERAALTNKAMAYIAEQWKSAVDINIAMKLATKIANHTSETLGEFSKRVSSTTGRKKVTKTEPAEESAREEKMISAETAKQKDNAKLQDFRRSFSIYLQSKVLGSIGESLRVNILANTSEVREVGESEMITRLNLTLREDGFENVQVEKSDGSTSSRLIPE